MSSADSSWRVGAIFRSCVRNGRDREWAEARLTESIGKRNAASLAETWFRQDPFFNTIDDARAPGLKTPAGFSASVIDKERERFRVRVAENEAIRFLSNTPPPDEERVHAALAEICADGEPGALYELRKSGMFGMIKEFFLQGKSQEEVRDLIADPAPACEPSL